MNLQQAFERLKASDQEDLDYFWNQLETFADIDVDDLPFCVQNLLTALVAEDSGPNNTFTSFCAGYLLAATLLHRPCDA